MTGGGSYHANGSGRDTYITRDPVVHIGVSEPTPRPDVHNPPGLTPRPPSSLARGAKAPGYTGFLPKRKEGVGKSFSQLSEKQDTKNLIPKLQLKHRFVQPPNTNFGSVTSREYGSYFTPKEPSGSRTERNKGTKLPKLKPYTGGVDPSIVQNEYWQLHKPGGPSSPRATQRTSIQDGELGYSRFATASNPTQSRQLVGLSNLPQGYTGYKPRFRFCMERDDANRMTTM